VVGRPRPYASIAEVDRLMGAVGSSFPSGHAATSAAGLAVLAIAVPRLAPALAVLAAAIAFSRIYVGVHYPSDVLVGAAIGAIVGVAAAWLTLLRKPDTGLSPRRRGPRRD
jgi:undecaprenyl-diphosphatase